MVPEPPTTARTFVALPLPAPTREAVAALGRRLTHDAGAARAVTPGAVHLTLAFLGDVPRDALPEVVTAAGTAATAADPFPLVLAGVDGFPDARRARLAYLACAVGGEAATRLHAALLRALPTALQPDARRPFTPHVTLARARGRAPLRLQGLPAALRAARLEAGEVAQLQVMRSDLTPHGARHSVQAALPLGADGADPPLRPPHGGP